LLASARGSVYKVGVTWQERAMKRLFVAGAAVAAALLLACVIPPGGWPIEDGGAEDGALTDRGAGTDAGQRIDAGLSTDRGYTCPCGMQCNNGAIGCECCGSNGPQAICLCTNRCNDDLDCRQPGLPFCNKPDQTSPGICTTQGYNCCWQCQ
jgi:hypothetical protein